MKMQWDSEFALPFLSCDLNVLGDCPKKFQVLKGLHNSKTLQWGDKSVAKNKTVELKRRFCPYSSSKKSKVTRKIGAQSANIAHIIE